MRTDSLELPITASQWHGERDALRRRYLLGERLQIILLVLAAAVSLISVTITISGPELVVGPVLSGLFLLITVFVDLLVLEEGLLRRWTDAALAYDQLSSEAWRFSVGSERYSTALSDHEAEDRFSVRLADLLGQRPAELTESASVLPLGAQLTDSMLECRNRPRERRTEAYLGRLDDFAEQIAAEAGELHRRGRVLRRLARALQVATLGVAIAQAVGLIDLNLVGLGVAAVTAILAWRAVRSPIGLESEYSRVHGALLLSRDRIRRCRDERDLARLIEEAEDLLIDHRRRWAAALG